MLMIKPSSVVCTPRIPDYDRVQEIIKLAEIIGRWPDLHVELREEDGIVFFNGDLDNYANLLAAKILEERMIISEIPYYPVKRNYSVAINFLTAHFKETTVVFYHNRPSLSEINSHDEEKLIVWPESKGDDLILGDVATLFSGRKYASKEEVEENIYFASDLFWGSI